MQKQQADGNSKQEQMSKQRFHQEETFVAAEVGAELAVQRFAAVCQVAVLQGFGVETRQLLGA